MYYNVGKSSEFKSDNVKRFDLFNKFFLNKNKVVKRVI